MASSSLGTLTYDLVAKIGGFTAGMNQAEREAKKSADAINKQIESIGVAGYAVGTALGQYLKQGIDLAINAFPELIDQAAQFADIADKTGGSAEGFANFAVSAKVAGVSVEDLASQSAKLSKALLEAGEDSKPITAGLEALGINIEEFKKLKPDEQFKKLANSFGEFAEGGEKAAVAQQILGKAGADTLKFFKDYVENGGDVNILTQDMIDKADAFGDAQVRMRAQLSLTASAIATQFIEPIDILTKTVKDAITEAYGLNGSAKDLASNQGIKNFAEDAGRALAGLLDYIATTKNELATLADFAGSTYEAVKKYASFDFEGGRKVGEDFRSRYGLDEFGRKMEGAGKEGAKSFSQAFEDELSRRRNDRNRALLNASNYNNTGTQDNRPPLNPIASGGGGKSGGGKKDNSAAQEAKAQLDADLAAIKTTQRELTDSYSNQERILEAMRSAGLKDESAYYKEKNELLQKNIEAQVQAQQATIQRLQSENVSGKDAIDNAKKIADAQYQLNKVQADGATQAKILEIQQVSAYNKMASAILAAKQAAQGFLDAQKQQEKTALEGIGKGNKKRDFDSGISQINDKYDTQRQTIENYRVQLEFEGKFTEEAKHQYEERMQIVDNFQKQSVESYTNYYRQLEEKQADWKNGATESLNNYADEAKNTAKLTEEAFSSAFKGLEDVLTEFVTTGKLNFKSLADSIIKDFLRIAIKQQITGPLASGLSSAIGSGGGDWLSSLFGSGASAAVGSSMNFWGGGYTGAGGKYDPAGIVHKGEYVLTAEQTKAIGVNNLNSGKFGGGFQQSNTFVVQGNITRDTQTQVANKLRRETNTAAARFGQT